MTHIWILYYAIFVPYKIEQITQDLQLPLLPNLSEAKKDKYAQPTPQQLAGQL